LLVRFASNRGRVIIRFSAFINGRPPSAGINLDSLGAKVDLLDFTAKTFNLERAGATHNCVPFTSLVHQDHRVPWIHL